ncbi:hypothetical protein MOQ72_25020 [Saccharopolyspora sp. K220]|uniref:hypothetical protein n=1 Tax=Saccharopolyspora soli TaxID=2926618 RepID=UPI001F59E99D|nr:hypothetical protein [Saccharopolyspora soli]MCI2420715.1 hypothetical protein [Saccharopolyspora soli]
MTRNRVLSGTTEYELIEELEQAITQALPPAWDLTAEHQPRYGGYRLDAVFRIEAPDGNRATVVAEVKMSAEPRTVLSSVEQMRHIGSTVPGDAIVVAAPFISPLARGHLADAGFGWFDLTGNMRLALDRPSVLIQRYGVDRNPFSTPADRRLKSLRGPGAARVVRTLLEIELPVGVRDLAMQAEVGAATSARVVDLLDREGLVERGAGKVISEVRRRPLVRRWTDDYGLTSSNEVERAVDPRGLAHALDELRTSEDQYIVTGSAAARAYLPADVLSVAPLTTLILYADQPRKLARNIGLRTTDRSANVLLVRPFDDALAKGSRVEDGIRYAAAPQVVADLLTGPGRSTEEAEQLMNLMAEKDPRWTE